MGIIWGLYRDMGIIRGLAPEARMVDPRAGHRGNECLNKTGLLLRSASQVTMMGKYTLVNMVSPM